MERNMAITSDGLFRAVLVKSCREDF
uniref:Uncharacterized protein n=1 Tax=Nelumbo nucifera TaxID=4432 RepID=A0A822XK26_NELNU|nr:TPA_asm: hypothetical protein HUJ06_022121 [Nelumbo nucifera]